MRHYGYLTRDSPERKVNYMNMQKVKKVWHEYESVMPFLLKMFLCLQEAPLRIIN